MKIKEAMEVIRYALENDEGFRLNWESNLSAEYIGSAKKHGNSNNDVAAYEAANNFINFICKQV